MDIDAANADHGPQKKTQQAIDRASRTFDLAAWFGSRRTFGRHRGRRAKVSIKYK
jgi:hypothetical protein